MKGCIIMGVTNLNKTEIEKMSMVDLAHLIFAEEQRPMSFKETFDKIAQLKSWDEEEKGDKIAQFYTDLNIDGRFVTNGSNSWGLKRWYRSEQIREDLSMDDLDDMIVDIDVDDVLDDIAAAVVDDASVVDDEFDVYVSYAYDMSD